MHRGPVWNVTISRFSITKLVAEMAIKWILVIAPMRIVEGHIKEERPVQQQ
jgi:hypothetical protein